MPAGDGRRASPGGLALISIATASAFSSLGPAWTIPLQFLGGQAAAGGIAAINSFGNIGGFLAPFVMGRLMLRPQGDSLALAYLAGVLLVSALLALLVNRRGAMSGQGPFQNQFIESSSH